MVVAHRPTVMREIQMARRFSRSRDEDARPVGRLDLVRAIYDGKRLASFRRVLGALLLATGVPILVLSRSTDSKIRRVLTVLATIWLLLVLPMVRVLVMEWQNRRVTDRLRAIVGDHRDTRR
jgi:hypothetical protein